jgi:cyclopropane-fatty-acyl-phospholipid synthase
MKRSVFRIPSVTSLLTAMTRASDLRLLHLEDIGLHYAKTLRLWRQRFFQAQEKVIGLGFDNAFIRLWEFYFSYCEAGFAEGYLGDMHLHFVKPLAIRAK